MAAAPPPLREVEIVQLTAADLPVQFEFVGRTASSQRVEIRSRVSGFLEAISYDEGTPVSEGDVLFEIDREPFEAQLRAAKAALSQQQARLENAQALFARIEPLAASEAIAQKELDDARGSVREATAAVEGAAAGVYEAELNLGYTTIHAPLSGMSGQSAQREGAYISGMAGPLTYVAKVDPIWVEFSVSETQVLQARASQGTGSVVYPDEDQWEVEIVLADGTVHPYRGNLTFADATISEQTGTFLVRADIPNPDLNLRPGQYARVVMHGAVRPGAIAVPQRAVRQGPRGAFVWVVSKDGKAEQRPVVTGPWVGDLWVIEKGLTEDDRLIVSGTVGLRPGVPVSIVSIARSAGAPAAAGE